MSDYVFENDRRKRLKEGGYSRFSDFKLITNKDLVEKIVV